MADNTTLNTGSGGDTIASDDIAGVKYPRSKIVIGADGTNDGDVSSANPLPVSLASVPSHAVTNAGTFVVQVNGDALTSLQLLDNAISGAGFNITQFAGAAVPIGAGLEATAVRVTLATDSTGLVSVDDNGGSLTVDGTVAISGTVTVDSHAVTNAGTFAVQAAQSGTWTVTGSGGTFPVTDSGGSLTIDNAALSTTGGGLETGSLRVTIASDSTGVLSVDDNGGSLTVDGTVAATQSGTWNIGTVTTVTGVATVTTVTTCSTVTTLTGSGVAHDGADSGNPHKIGAKAIAALSGATLVAAADRTDLYAGIDGVLITRSHCNLEDIVSGVVAIADGSSTSAIGAQGAGVKTYITSATISNTSATDVTVDLRDGTAGSVKWTFPVPQTGGVTHTFDPPLPFSANTIVAADPSAAASTVTISLLGFKSKV